MVAAAWRVRSIVDSSNEPAVPPPMKSIWLGPVVSSSMPGTPAYPLLMATRTGVRRAARSWASPNEPSYLDGNSGCVCLGRHARELTNVRAKGVTR